jgi:hypothetical protein
VRGSLEKEELANTNTNYNNNFFKKTGQITYPKPKTRGSLSLKMLKNLEPEGIGNKHK